MIFFSFFSFSLHRKTVKAGVVYQNSVPEWGAFIASDIILGVYRVESEIVELRIVYTDQKRCEIYVYEWKYLVK